MIRARTCLAVGLLGASPAILAQPPAVDVIDSVSQYQSGSCAWVDVRFEQVVGYLGHFPSTKSNQLRISVQLLTQPDVLSPGARESLHVCPREPFNVRWITFEGGHGGRGAVYVDFSKETRYRVGQGADFRSVLISLPATDGAEPCDPADFRKHP